MAQLEGTTIVQRGILRE